MDDRPALDESEIEVTPEMIEAGADALAAFNEKFSSLEDGAWYIYRAMMSARVAKNSEY